MTPPAQRPARFLRIEKAVAIPDEDIVDLDNTAFGPNIQQGMREIIGYAPIEPDGSVRVKVPANVALAVSVLDANGRRISARHQNWLQVVPGQELDLQRLPRADEQSLARPQHGFDAAYAGATSTGVPFPNTVRTFSPDVGETMAETRTRVSCQTDCAALEPSVDVLYTRRVDEPGACATPSAPISYLLHEPDDDGADQRQLHRQLGRRACRIVINYETHIHPLWSAPRQVLDPMTTATCSRTTPARSRVVMRPSTR